MTLAELIKANPNADDAAIVALANAPVYSRIPIATIREIVPPFSIISSLELTVLNAAEPEAKRQLAAAILKVLAGPFTVIDRTNPADNAAFEQMVPAALAAGIITQAQADALLALGKTVPANPVTLEQVAAARLVVERDNAERDLNAWATDWVNDVAGAITLAREQGQPVPTKQTLAELLTV